MERKEFILCAAIRLFNGTIVSGFRHKDCYEVLRDLVPDLTESEEPGREDQGFLTSKNRYVDRAEGFKIAKENKQIIHSMFDNDDEGQLTSEDLY